MWSPVHIPSYLKKKKHLGDTADTLAMNWLLCSTIVLKVQQAEFRTTQYCIRVPVNTEI